MGTPSRGNLLKVIGSARSRKSGLRSAKGLRSALYSVLLGFLGLFLAFVQEAIIHSIHHRDYQLLGINSAGYASLEAALIVAVAVARFCKGRAWWNGLLAGLSIIVPAVLFVLHSMSPNPETWTSLLFGRPMTALWAPLVCLLLITSLGAESTSLWFDSRRVVATLTAGGAAILVVAVTATGFRLQKFYQVHDAAARASAALAQMNMPLPDLNLAAVDGAPASASELQGHVTVVDFWGTWCAACLAELPSVEAAKQEYASDSRVRFLIVDPGIAGDTPEKIRRFLTQRPVSIPVLLARGAAYFELCNKLKNEGLPLLLVVDRRGYIRFELSGYESNEKTRRDLRRDINALLAARQ